MMCMRAGALAPPLKVNDANGELHGAGGEWQVCRCWLALGPNSILRWIFLPG
jgi:hypothetical protein